MQPSGPPLDLLNLWAAHHGVDDDLALLICACAAAHAAGPRLRFEGPPDLADCPAPTVIAPAGDTGFHSAVKAAVAPLQAIQRELLAQSVEPVAKPVPKDPARRINELIEAKINESHAHICPAHKNPARGLHPDTQPGRPVRFVLEGPLPAKPVPLLKQCHLYAAMSVGELEHLPRSCHSRHNRADLIWEVLGGYRHGHVSIRGFMRFAAEDLEWLKINDLGSIMMALPMESLDSRGPVPSTGAAAGARELDHLHRAVLRRIVDLRFGSAEFDTAFRGMAADRRFRELRQRYRSEDYAVAHLAKTPVILPDLFVWYLLQPGMSYNLKIDEMEVAGHAIAAARRLRRRLAGFHDRQVAVQRARERLELATKLMARMRRLGRPCKRRDLARGFDNQRMDRIGPVIDSLVELGFFSRNSKWLSPGAAADARAPRLEDFMEALVDVPHSATRRLNQAEEGALAANREPQRMTGT